MDEKNVQSIMNLIIYGGDGRSSAMEAIQAAKKGDFDLAEERLAAADKSLLEAHHSQTEMMSKEENRHPVDVSLLMLHGQEHLMTRMMCRNLKKEIVELYRTVKENLNLSVKLICVKI